MKYNLTDKQKELARTLVKFVRDGNLPEGFDVSDWGGEGLHFPQLKPEATHNSEDVRKGKIIIDTGGPRLVQGRIGTFDALAEGKLLIQRLQPNGRTCTLTRLIFSAVDSDFADQETPTPISTLTQPHPPEITMSLDRLRTKYPDPKKLGFLVMRFTAAKAFARIVEIIKATAEKHGLAVVRADEQEFHADLWGNVRTHLHGCGFGVAVYERIETDEPNANVGLEVGYLLAMNKPVLLLKDKTLEAIQSDLAGKLYKNFDPHDPEGTIPELLNKWLEDNGIVVPKRP